MINNCIFCNSKLKSVSSLDLNNETVMCDSILDCIKLEINLETGKIDSYTIKNNDYFLSEDREENFTMIGVVYRSDKLLFESKEFKYFELNLNEPESWLDIVKSNFKLKLFE